MVNVTSAYPGVITRNQHLHKATITWCDLSSRFFCIDATSLCELESDKYESTSLNRIAADKSHSVIAG